MRGNNVKLNFGVRIKVGRLEKDPNVFNKCRLSSKNCSFHYSKCFALSCKWIPL
jgi:hypothetical protein